MIPLTATAGSSGVSITITGRDFAGLPTVLWNGTALPTSLINDTQLQASVPASALTTAGQASVSVVNPSPSSGASNSFPFSINPPAPSGNVIAVFAAGGNHLVWDALAQRIYVSAPSVQGDLGDAITVVDPVAGTISASQFIGSEPAKLSLSNDSQFLYVGMNGENSVRRLTLPGLTPDISWHLGADSFEGAYFAQNVLAAPGLPHTSAVSRANFDISPSSAGVAIYDDATPRPTAAPGWNSGAFSYASLEWGSAATTLYAPAQLFPTDFYVLSVTPSGVSVTQTYSDAFNFPTSDFDIHYDAGTGLLYPDGGQVLNPTNGSTVGNFNASGIALRDSTLNRVFFLGQTTAQAGTSSFTIQSFDQSKFSLLNSITVPNVVGIPTGFIRWGSDALAFTTRIGAPTDFMNIGPGQLYVVSGGFVNHSAGSSPAADTRFAEHVRRTWSSQNRDVRPAHKSR
jgi:hypothetical protein